jgi:hypothetical protein
LPHNRVRRESAEPATRSNPEYGLALENDIALTLEESKMFETPETKRESSGAGLYIVIAIVVVLIAGGAWAYMNSKGGSAAPAAAAAPDAAAQANSDPVKDLRVVSAKMEKDYTGTTAVWSVEVKNQSQTYSYSNIAYETTYAGADNATLADNHGSIAGFSLGPGETQDTQFKDAGYPAGTAWFKFRVTGATASR